MKKRLEKKLMKSIDGVIETIDNLVKDDDVFSFMVSGETGLDDIRKKHPKKAYRWHTWARRKFFRLGVWGVEEGKTYFSILTNTMRYIDIMRNQKTTVSILVYEPGAFVGTVYEVNIRKFINDADYHSNAEHISAFGYSSLLIDWIHQPV